MSRADLPGTGSTGGAVILLMLACGADAGLTAPGGTDPPGLTILAPAEHSELFLGQPVELRAQVTDPDGDSEAAQLWWASASQGLLEGEASQDGDEHLLQIESLEVGSHLLVALARDEDGGVGRTSVTVTVVDPDLDGDGHWQESYGGDDCAPLDPERYPGAVDFCDSFDQDCDEEIDEDAELLTWYPDADGDGAGDPYSSLDACAQPAGYVDNPDDCDDTDASRQLCVDCAALRTSVWDVGDGEYSIDPIGGAPFSVLCDMTYAEGGWTLVGTTTWDPLEWNEISISDPVPFGAGPSLTTSHKSLAFSSVPFAELYFENGESYAHYEPNSGGGLTLWQFLDEIPLYNCGASDGLAWALQYGDLAHEDLCDQDLYIHTMDHDGDASCTFYSWSHGAFGPTWSMAFNDGCPLDDTNASGFIGAGYGPWDNTLPLRMWVRSR